MSTLSDISAWVCQQKLVRSDMNDVAIDAAQQIYQLVCAKIPFDELQQITAERAVSTLTTTHSLADIDPAIAGIISIRMTYGTGRVRRLTRSIARAFDNLNPTTPGQPSRYARFGTNSIEFDRLANASSYTYRIRYWSRPTIDVTAGDTAIVTPPEWDELYRWEALWRVYTILERHQEASMLIQPSPMPKQASPVKIRMSEVGIIPRLWNDLLRTVSQRENTDEDFSINPSVRSYTSVRGG